MPSLAEFEIHILKGQAAPEDLAKLVAIEANRQPDPDNYLDPLEAMHCHLLQIGVTPELLDTSYLTAEEQAKPDIAANIKAIADVCTYITFVAVDDDKHLYGYWHGPEGVDIAHAPIVRFDSEGQFELQPGRTLSEALLGEYAFDDDEEFTELKHWFADFGISIKAHDWYGLKMHDPNTYPNELHQKLYAQYRANAGLPPVAA